MNHRSKLEGVNDSDGSGSDIDLDADESLFRMKKTEGMSKADEALAILEQEKEDKRNKVKAPSNNPNRQKEKMMKISDMKIGEPVKELSRKEREAIEAAKAEADYRKRHAAGETHEAKADLARLAAVKKSREVANAKKEEAAKKEAEEAAAAAIRAEKEKEAKKNKKKKGKKAADSSDDDDGESNQPPASYYCVGWKSQWVE
jgi:hypothetical protein